MIVIRHAIGDESHGETRVILQALKSVSNLITIIICLIMIKWLFLTSVYQRTECVPFILLDCISSRGSIPARLGWRAVGSGLVACYLKHSGNFKIEYMTIALAHCTVYTSLLKPREK